MKMWGMFLWRCLVSLIQSVSLITKGEKGRCRHHPTGRGCRKSGEISSEKVKPSTLIPAEGHHHEGMNGGGRDARRIQIAVKFLNVNAATEINRGTRKLAGSLVWKGIMAELWRAFPQRDAEPYLHFLCSAATPIGTRKPNLLPDLWILLINTPKLSRFMQL